MNEEMLLKYIEKAIWKGCFIERHSKDSDDFWERIDKAPSEILRNMKRSKSWVEGSNQ